MPSSANDDISVTTLDLLRHGRCDDQCHLRGNTDSTLSEQGWQQMLQAVNLWPHQKQWQCVISSPLQRCEFFAQSLAKHKNLQSYTWDSLREMNFGLWDGLSLEALNNQHGDAYMQFWQQPEQHTPPQGEALTDFHQRITKALQQITQLHRGQHCLVVTHGGVIRSLVGLVLNQSLSHLNRLQVGYGSFCQLQIFHHPHNPDWMQLTRLQPLPNG